ncbi:uncharacterized protein K02A2.6-like [Armigeres subalbatus]|uniref:uncharacterized protein K02A2.6-like n=1 Tax=Armigeres subalbatus TaxID=124917 RepID=UPI002ED0C121
MVVVPKGKDDIRLCINMKYPNEAIQREHYPLPMIETFLNKLRGSTIFSKLDITSAYYHIELHPESRGITTFMTSRGLMRFKRLMFGINCAPEIFQRVMSEMLAGIDGVVVYIDDVVVAGSTQEEHDTRLQKVLSVLKKNNATLNKSKCLIGVTELEILGFKVSTAGICPSDEKIAAIQNFRKPESREETRSFLGLINFVGQFIPHLSTRSEALRKFIRGDVDVFGKAQQEAFDDLRNELSNTVRRLGFFDPKDKTELYVDASPVGLGAVLTQRNGEQTSRIISFASKGLTKTEGVYPQTQREALAVFTIFTDHKTLEYIYGGKHQQGKRACSRAEGWALRLQPYDFCVKHIPGTSNISDVLSRLSVKAETTTDIPFDEATEHYLCAIGDGPAAISLQQIKDETIRDEVLQAVSKALQSHEWSPGLISYQAFSNELGIIDGIIVRDERIILPSSLRRRALVIAHRGHPGIVTMRRNLREKVWWPYMDRDVREYTQECAGCAAVSSQCPPEPMLRKEMPDRAWQEIAIDFFSAKECATFLVTVDYYSRFIRVTEMKGTNASKTIEALEEMFREHTYPETIRSDNGPPFSSEEFSNYCNSKNIRLVRTIPYWPQMNGLVERQNQGILRTLRIAKAIKADWRKAVQDYVYAYNTTPHSVTGKAPMELLTGGPVKDLLPSLRTETHWRQDEETRDKDAIKKMQGKAYADHRRHAKPSDIEVGDDVLLKNYETGKLEPKFKLDKFKVIKRTGNDVVVTNEEGVMYRRPVSHLRKWPSTKASEQDIEPETPVFRPAHYQDVPEAELDERDGPTTAKEGNTMKRLQAKEYSTLIRPKRDKKLPARYSSH